MANMGNVPIRQNCLLRSALESKTSQMKQTERDARFDWCAEASSKGLQDSKIVLLKGSLLKG